MAALLAGLTPLSAQLPKPVLLFNRIGPSASILYIANADGTGERRLPTGSRFDYSASFSPDGTSLVFTSERDGLGQAEIYRMRLDGSGLERLTTHPALDDQAALSPDGRQLAFVSTREAKTANIWVLDVSTRAVRNLTGRTSIQGEAGKPNGFFRPSWSPDGRRIAFSSDRNTPWKGHSNGAGWEHVQQLGVYIVGADGEQLRMISRADVASGSPKWSPDGRRVVYYELPTESTFNARMPMAGSVTSQIVSVDVATGERTEHTSGPGLKVSPQYVGPSRVGYAIKAGPKEGLAYSAGDGQVPGRIRAPAWSGDGRLVVYQRETFDPIPQNAPLYSWSAQYEYRHTDIFPVFSKDGRLAVTDFSARLSFPSASLSTMEADGSDRRRVFADGTGTAYGPTWSPDGQWLAFGFGTYFGGRSSRPGTIMRMRADGSHVEALTSGPMNAGFPSWSPDGTRIVYRAWDKDAQGLRVLDVATRQERVLTTDYDNVPEWAPHADRILFTRRHGGRFNLFTIEADGSGLRQLTAEPSNDAHAAWSEDGTHILWSSGRYGFKDEAAMYDNNPQPYAALFMMKADGSEVRQLTDSRWEDAMPRFVPRRAPTSGGPSSR
jgi:Tol biopolymer transport system component